MIYINNLIFFIAFFVKFTLVKFVSVNISDPLYIIKILSFH